MSRQDRIHATRSAFAEIGMLMESIMAWNSRNGTGGAAPSVRASALDNAVFRSIANANLPVFTDHDGRWDGPAS